MTLSLEKKVLPRLSRARSVHFTLDSLGRFFKIKRGQGGTRRRYRLAPPPHTQVVGGRSRPTASRNGTAKASAAEPPTPFRVAAGGFGTRQPGQRAAKVVDKEGSAPTIKRNRHPRGLTRTLQRENTPGALPCGAPREKAAGVRG